MLKLAFKFASSTDLWERFISVETQSPFCHVEAWVDERGWFSAREETGVGYAKDLDLACNWRMVDVPYTLTPEAIAWADSTVGAKYDWLSLADFILHDGLISAGKEICSRAVKDLLTRCHWDGPDTAPAFLPNPSPGDLARAFIHDVEAPAPAAFTADEMKQFAQRAIANATSRDVEAFGSLIDMTSINAAADSVKALADKLATDLAGPEMVLAKFDWAALAAEVEAKIKKAPA